MMADGKEVCWPSDGLCSGCNRRLPPFAFQVAKQPSGSFCLSCVLKGKIPYVKSTTILSIAFAPHFGSLVRRACAVLAARGKRRRIRLLRQKQQQQKQQDTKEDVMKGLDVDWHFEQCIGPLLADGMTPGAICLQTATTTTTTTTTSSESRPDEPSQDEKAKDEPPLWNGRPCTVCGVSRMMVLSFMKEEIQDETSKAEHCLRCFLTHLETIPTSQKDQRQYFRCFRWSALLCAAPLTSSTKTAAIAESESESQRHRGTKVRGAFELMLRLANSMYARLYRLESAALCEQPVPVSRSVLDAALGAFGYGGRASDLSAGYTMLGELQDRGLLDPCLTHLWRGPRTPARTVVPGTSIIRWPSGGVLKSPPIVPTHIVRSFPSNQCTLLWSVPIGDAARLALFPHILLVGTWPTAHSPLLSPDVLFRDRRQEGIIDPTTETNDEKMKTCGCMPPRSHRIADPNADTAWLPDNWMPQTISLLKQAWDLMIGLLPTAGLCADALGTLNVLAIVVPPDATERRLDWTQLTVDVSGKEAEADENVLRHAHGSLRWLFAQKPSAGRSGRWMGMDCGGDLVGGGGLNVLLARDLGEAGRNPMADVLQPFPYGMYMWDGDVLLEAVDGTWEVNQPLGTLERTVPPVLRFVYLCIRTLINSRLRLKKEGVTTLMKLVADAQARCDDERLRLILSFAAPQSIPDAAQSVPDAAQSVPDPPSVPDDAQSVPDDAQSVSDAQSMPDAQKTQPTSTTDILPLPVISSEPAKVDPIAALPSVSRDEDDGIDLDPADERGARLYTETTTGILLPTQSPRGHTMAGVALLSLFLVVVLSWMFANLLE